MLPNITFHSSSKIPISLYLKKSYPHNRVNEITECHFFFQVSPDFYRQIDTDTIFNLKPEFRTPFSSSDFLPDRPIQLEVTLHPDLLPQLLAHAQTAEEAAAYLQALSQQQVEQFQSNAVAEKPTENPQNPVSFLNPLLYTESWFCLSVKQQQDSGETGYTTFWNYVNPAILNQPETSSDQIAKGITNFIKDWTAANLTAATQDITEDLFKGVTTLFDGVETWLDNAISGNDDDARDGDESILETVIDFFTEDDWTFTKLQGQSTLQVACQGENGRWNCYAQAQETQEQFVFYSIYPEVASEDKRLAMAEFLTRANYGLIIGNFEMDFNDGEIRYKTSIDIEGDFLTTDLTKQLVYANIMMMDHYIPGIQAIINGGLSAAEAISQVENPTATAATTDDQNALAP